MRNGQTYKNFQKVLIHRDIFENITWNAFFWVHFSQIKDWSFYVNLSETDILKVISVFPFVHN